MRSMLVANHSSSRSDETWMTCVVGLSVFVEIKDFELYILLWYTFRRVASMVVYKHLSYVFPVLILINALSTLWYIFRLPSILTCDCHHSTALSLSISCDLLIPRSSAHCFKAVSLPTSRPPPP